MGGLILFIGAIFAALFGLAIVMAYITLAVFLAFIVGSVAIFYYFGVAWGLAWLGGLVARHIPHKQSRHQVKYYRHKSHQITLGLHK